MFMRPVRHVSGRSSGTWGAMITLALTGDVMLGRGVAEVLDNRMRPEAPWGDVMPLLDAAGTGAMPVGGVAAGAGGSVDDVPAGPWAAVLGVAVLAAAGLLVSLRRRPAGRPRHSVGS